MHATGIKGVNDPSWDLLRKMHTNHFREEIFHREYVSPLTMFRHYPLLLCKTSFPDGFCAGKNNRSYRRTSPKVEDRYFRCMGCLRLSPSNLCWQMVFAIYCIACAYCGLHKKHARTLSCRLVWKGYRDSHLEI